MTTIPPAQARQLLRKIARLRLLVVGDVMLDHYVWGDATRISPEAPVPVIKKHRETDTAGGAANVAANVRSLGAEAEVCGWIGDDEAGRRLLEALDDLPHDQKEVIMMGIFQDMSYAEMEEVTGTKAVTLRSRMFHGLRRLAKLIGGNDSPRLR